MQVASSSFPPQQVYYNKARCIFQNPNFSKRLLTSYQVG